LDDHCRVIREGPQDAVQVRVLADGGDMHGAQTLDLPALERDRVVAAQVAGVSITVQAACEAVAASQAPRVARK